MNGWKCRQKWASSFGDKCVCTNGNIQSEYRKLASLFTWKPHLPLKCWGWQDGKRMILLHIIRESGSAGWRQLDEGNHSQGRGCVQGQSLFLCTPELTLTGTCKQGRHFMAPWQFIFPPYADPQSVIPGVFTQPQGQGNWRMAKIQKFCSVFQQTLFSFTPAWNLGQCKWPEPLAGIVSLRGPCRVHHILPAASLLKTASESLGNSMYF